MNRTIPPQLAAFVLLGALACAGLIEWGAYYSGLRAEARTTARRHLPANYCVSCHSDAHSMKVMLDKEGREGARLPGGLLDPDGTSLAVSATPGVCPVASKGVGAVPSAPQAQPPTVRK